LILLLNIDCWPIWVARDSDRQWSTPLQKGFQDAGVGTQPSRENEPVAWILLLNIDCWPIFCR
jgi:hypothetical protein